LCPVFETRGTFLVSYLEGRLNLRVSFDVFETRVTLGFTNLGGNILCTYCCSKFDEDRSINDVTFLSTDAGRTDGRLHDFVFCPMHMHCIGQTTSCSMLVT